MQRVGGRLESYEEEEEEEEEGWLVFNEAKGVRYFHKNATACY